MKIGILVCGESSDLMKNKYTTPYEDFFTEPLGRAESSLEFNAYNVFDNQFPESVHDCDGWLITGSKNGVYEQLDWMITLEQFIKKAYSFYIPLVGICFGHQMIAHALGGKVVKSEKGWGLGYAQYDVINGLPKPMEVPVKLFCIHQDQVVEAPKDAKVTLSNDHCEIAGLAYEGAAISFQPHPEFNEDFLTDLIESIKGEKLDVDFANQALAELKGKEVHNEQIMKLIAKFYLDPPRPKEL